MNKLKSVAKRTIGGTVNFLKRQGSQDKGRKPKDLKPGSAGGSPIVGV